MADQEDWLSPVEAAAFIRDRLRVPTGKAQAILKEARASGEVRWEPPLRNLMHEDEDGVVTLDFDFSRGNLTAAAIERQHGRHINKNDLVYWLDTHHPPQAPTAATIVTPAPRYRHSGDAELISEGRKLIEGGMTKLKAAEALAPPAVPSSKKQSDYASYFDIAALAVIGTAKDRQS